MSSSNSPYRPSSQPRIESHPLYELENIPSKTTTTTTSQPPLKQLHELQSNTGSLKRQPASTNHQIQSSYSTDDQIPAEEPVLHVRTLNAIAERLILGERPNLIYPDSSRAHQDPQAMPSRLTYDPNPQSFKVMESVQGMQALSSSGLYLTQEVIKCDPGLKGVNLNLRTVVAPSTVANSDDTGEQSVQMHETQISSGPVDIPLLSDRVCNEWAIWSINAKRYIWCSPISEN